MTVAQKSRGISALVDRAMEDEAFLSRLRNSPEEAISQYDIDDETASAIVDGDERGIEEVLGAHQADEIPIVVVIVL